MDGSENKAARRAGALALLLTLALWVGIEALATHRLRPPDPRGEDAPTEVFSAARARRVLERLADGVGPHPVGSPGADTVRARLVEELAALGLAPALQQTFVCAPHGSCATTRNVLARITGSEPGPGVLLVAHYDSVPAGPGISDDLVGTAALVEVARALAGQPTPRHSVLFLWTEGEEAGLLGARAFARHNPALADVGVVLNVEARGTSGPSYMFETGAGNAQLIERFAQSVERPFATSFSGEVYRRMPNDTDFTIFRELGLPGLNFAFIEGFQYYHTPLDDLAHADLGSLQHHGDQLLGMARSLCLDPLAISRNPRVPHEDAFYFDVLGFFLVRGPIAWSLPLSFLALLVALASLTLARNHERIEFGGVARALGVLLALGLTLILCGILLAGLLRAMSGSGGPWAADPMRFTGAVCAGGLALLAFIGWTRARPAHLLAAVWLGLGLLAVLTAFLLPGAAYLFFVPSLGLALSGAGFALDVDRSKRAMVCSAFGLILALMLWTPVRRAVAAAFLHEAELAITLPYALLGGFLAVAAAELPSGLRKWMVAVGLAGFLGATVLVWRLPAHDAEHPGHQSFTYLVDTTAGTNTWLVSGNGTLDEEMLRFGEFEELSRLRDYATWGAEAPALAIAPPTLEKISGSVGQGKEEGQRRVRARVRPGGDGVTTLFCTSRVKSVTAGGVDVPLARRYQVRLWSLPPEGIELELLIDGLDPLHLELVAERFGLPAEGRALAELRPASRVPVAFGDRTVVSTQVEL